MMRFEAPPLSSSSSSSVSRGRRHNIVRSQPVEIPTSGGGNGSVTSGSSSSLPSGGLNHHHVSSSSSPSRSVGTQTPTERLSFVFPDPSAGTPAPAGDGDTVDDQNGTLVEAAASESPGGGGVVVVVARGSIMTPTPSSPTQAINPLTRGNHCDRNLLRGGVLPDVVPGGRPRHPLGRRGSDGMLASGAAESIGQELRSIADAYDRTRITRSRSLSLVSSIFLNGRRRLSTSSV